MNQDIYSQVTDRIIAQLEQGVVPWKSPYFSKMVLPRNFASQRNYQGINVFLLGTLRFTSPYFLTFIQAKELGGHVRRGRKRPFGGRIRHLHQARGSDEEGQTRRFLKGYTVFNASQI